MAWNWYPAVDEQASLLPPRLHGHADMDLITLLFQRAGKLTAGHVYIRVRMLHSAGDHGWDHADSFLPGTSMARSLYNSKA